MADVAGAGSMRSLDSEGKSSEIRLPLDLRDTSALKALGILAIVLHNFFHLLRSTPKENEFGFSAQRFQHFLTAVVDPHQTFQSLFSYFGHFGVQLFIFLAAYGLALKYWRVPSWSGFVWGRIKKIYPTYFLVLALFLLVKALGNSPTEFQGFLLKDGDDLLLTTLGVVNLVPGYRLPPVGPWWFLPFIIQVYCLWAALAAFSRRFGLPGLAALSGASFCLMLAFYYPLEDTWSINLLQTPLGHIPELCLGIGYARFGVRVGLWSALAATGLFLLGNLQELFWPLTFISASIMLLYAYQLTSGAWRQRKLLEGIAQVSMALFFVHGFLRGPFLSVAAYFNRWYIELAVGLCFTLFAVGVAYALFYVEQRVLLLWRRDKGTPVLT